MIHITTTCDSVETARTLARAALDRRLAACANITPGVLSLFHWKGGVTEETEVSVTFKTPEKNRAALVTLIGEVHPYDLPVITWERVGTTAEAKRWCQDEADGSSD
jgi:periplasmic divalent cation tolerance protein